MVRMVRFTCITGLTLAASLAGCGGNNNNNNMNMNDMAILPDFAVVRDFTIPPTLAVTGAECKSSADCAPSMAPGNAKGMCTKSNTIGGMGTVMWPGGYCQSSCRPAKNDPM